MVQAAPMRVSWAALIGWALAGGLLVGLPGSITTWHLVGAEGLAAQVWAGGIVLTAVGLSALVVIRCAPYGPSAAAAAFLASGAVRVILTVAAGAAAHRWGDLPAAVLFTWLGVFYFVMLLGEGIWLARALRLDAQRASLGEIRRPSRALWDRHRIRTRRRTC